MGQLLQPGAVRAPLKAAVGGAHNKPAQLASIPPKYQTHLNAAGRYLPGTFQPTFLYESIWDLAVFGLLLLIERKVKLRRGYLFGAYAALYTFGRFWTEYLRIDPAHRYLGLRFNDWTSVAVFAVSSAVLLLMGRPKPGDELVGDELPPALLAEERARAARASKRGKPAAPGDAAEDAIAGGPAEIVESTRTSAGQAGSGGCHRAGTGRASSGGGDRTGTGGSGTGRRGSDRGGGGDRASAE